MEVITKEQLAQRRETIAQEQGLACGNDVRCYNCGKVMNSMGESRCAQRKGKTASYQWCKHFACVGKEDKT